MNRLMGPKRGGEIVKHIGCLPLSWSRSGSVIQDLSGSWCIKLKEPANPLALVMDSPVPLMYHDPGRSWITDPDPDHPKSNVAIKDYELPKTIQMNRSNRIKISHTFGSPCFIRTGNLTTVDRPNRHKRCLFPRFTETNTIVPSLYVTRLKRRALSANANRGNANQEGCYPGLSTN